MLRPVWPADPQKGPFPEVLQTIRRLLIRPGCFRLERELPGGICTHETSAPSQGTQLNGVDPQAWLADVLARIADHPAKRIGDLLPWNWRAAMGASAVAAA